MIPAKHTRRSFLNTSIAALGGTLTPGLFFNSCRPGGPADLLVDYIGSTNNFNYYQELFGRIRRTELILSSLESATMDDAPAAFLDTVIPSKATYAILLLEQGKDLLCTHPLGNTLSDFNTLREYILRHGRILGMVNPLIFYPSVIQLSDMYSNRDVVPEDILITCNPDEIVPGFSVSGIAGPVQLLQRTVSHFTGQYPVSLVAGPGGVANPGYIDLEYPSFMCRIRLDRNIRGWVLKVDGPGFGARLDHHGLLARTDQVQILLMSNTRTWDRAMIENMQDFTRAVQDRSEPRVSSLDCLASIILNRAVTESLVTGLNVRL